MEVYHVYHDLFTLADDYKLNYARYAHCVSADLKMGAGIAKQFDEKFHIRESLAPFLEKTIESKHFKNFDQFMEMYSHILFPQPTCFRVGSIYHLITKHRYYQKPTYDSMNDALVSLKEMCIKESVKILIMPKIGCGLDKLSWGKVYRMILSIFSDTKITIYICELPSAPTKKTTSL